MARASSPLVVFIAAPFPSCLQACMDANAEKERSEGRKKGEGREGAKGTLDGNGGSGGGGDGGGGKRRGRERESVAYHIQQLTIGTDGSAQEERNDGRRNQEEES